MADVMTFRIDGAQLIFRNFEGKEGMYNKKGDRNFAVIIPDEDTAQQMLRDGWAVKYLDPREEGDAPTPYISVNVKFENRPPRITLITSNARTNLTEDTVETLDWANLSNVDLICRSFYWEVNGKSGIKAYLQTMFATLEEDELERKYAQMEAEQE